MKQSRQRREEKLKVRKILGYIKKSERLVGEKLKEFDERRKKNGGEILNNISVEGEKRGVN